MLSTTDPCQKNPTVRAWSVQRVSFAIAICSIAACSTSNGDTNQATSGSATGAGSRGSAGGTGNTTGSGSAAGAGGGGGQSGTVTGGTGDAAGNPGSGGAGGTQGTAGSGGGAGDASRTGGTGGAAGSNGAAGSSGAAGSMGTGGASDGGGAAGSMGSGGAVDGGGSSECPSTARATAGETTETIMVGGMSRSFIRHIPTGYTGKKPLPVVIDFHPLGGTGSSQKGLSGWGTLADSKGFIVVWPNGVGNSWNVGRCCNPAQMQNVDDVAFTRAIISTLKQEACIDPKRVYGTGCSNGGGMAYMVACNAADVIAAVAPVDFDCTTNTSTNMSDQLNNSCAMCKPSRPISEIQFRGTNDSAVPYTGGLTPVVSGFYFPGAAKNLATWGSLNMCTGTPAALAAHPACQQYPTCGGSVDTVLCTAQNGTHCGNYSSLGIVNIAWEMFQKESLP